MQSIKIKDLRVDCNSGQGQEVKVKRANHKHADNSSPWQDTVWNIVQRVANNQVDHVTRIKESAKIEQDLLSCRYKPSKYTGSENSKVPFS